MDQNQDKEQTTAQTENVQETQETPVTEKLEKQPVKEATPAEGGDSDSEEIDDDMMSAAMEDLDGERLNLTAGKRSKEGIILD